MKWPHELPFKTGDWVFHRHQGKVLLTKISSSEVKVRTKHGDEIRMSYERAIEMLLPIERERTFGARDSKTTIRREQEQTKMANSYDPLPVISYSSDSIEYHPSPIEDKQDFLARPYQIEALKALTNCFSKHRSGILALPTGSGKTFVAAKWICDRFIRSGKKVIWIAHRIELLEQAYATFTKLLQPSMAHSITWWAGGRPKNPYGRLVLVSIMAARNFPPMHTDLLVIDEAHHEPAQTYRFFQDRISFEKHLGLTATPKRLDEKRLGYESIAYQKTFMSLVSEGWLARPMPVIPKTRLNFILERRMDDFSEESLATLDTDERNEFIAEHWSSNAEMYGKTLVFALNRAHARRLTNVFSLKRPDKRIAYIVSGEGSQDERFQKVARFRNGEIDVLINCRIFTEGFDCPDVRTIMITRPTLSTTLYLQMIGRGTRVTPNKKSFYLVDFEDDLGRFQAELIRPWYLGDEQEISIGVSLIPKERKWEYENFPEWLKKEIEVVPVELSLIAGYVTFILENEEDGFLVHKEDEQTFTKIWSRLEEEAGSSKPIQLARSAERYFAEMNPKRVPLPGLLYASMALAGNNARYVSLKEPQVSDDIMEFLSDVDISEEELANITNAIDDIYAVIKFTFDEIDQELRWKEIYESERDSFDRATKELDRKRELRGFDLQRAITKIYDDFLVDSHITPYEWERFAISRIKNPEATVLYVDVYTP